MPLFIGIDVGTQGVRVLCSDQYGNIAASGSRMFTDDTVVSGLAKGWSEQIPQHWWKLTAEALAEVVGWLRDSGRDGQEIKAVSVDSTSGTILPIDRAGNPLYPALMYNDSRASAEAALCNEAGRELCNRLGYRFSASFALPKILWILRNMPEIARKTYKIIHAADFIVGKLTGDYSVSDHSNALKTGYDLIELRWPAFISDNLGIDIDLLPRVVSPGDPIGYVGRECSELTGLPQGLAVRAGITDGTAGFLASGASNIGDWNTTLGTTLVLRGISDKLIADPKGRLYCHLSPDGMWLPGAAGNVGGECLEKYFGGTDFIEMDKKAIRLSPTGVSVYPLARRGERFPFLDPEAQGFISDSNIDSDRLYAACLEGVAYVERWCYEIVQSLACPVGPVVFTTGGGAKSRQWMQIRADVLRRELVRPRNTESAMGTAVIAASKSYYSNCAEAVGCMVKEDIRIYPRQEMVDIYESAYGQFRRQCADRGLGV